MHKEVYILIGVPGSGKSTLAQKLQKAGSYIHIDYDSVIRDNPHLVNQTTNDRGPVWDYIKNLALTSFGGGSSIILDATFAGFTFRRKFIQYLKEHGIHNIVGCLMCTPVHIAIERAHKRLERPVEKDSILYYQSLLDLHEPSLEDGFSELKYFDEFQIEVNLTKIQ